MSGRRVYLRPNVQAEPLVHGWYSWPLLIAPVPAAMVTANLHLKILQSYVKNPQVHAAAVKNPAMRGGPFLDFGGGRVAEVQGLIDRTRKERGHMLELAEAVRTLDGVLATEAKGHSLQGLYAKVPAPLRGYVELGYDLNNAPSLRLIEPLLYKSRFYNPEVQSLALSVIEKDERPFVLSTPRLPDGNSVHLGLPFTHPGLDRLFRMKFEAAPLDEIEDVLEGVSGDDRERLLSYFSEAPSPPRYPDLDHVGSGVRVRYFGHATVLVQSRGVSILTDPVISYRYDNGIPRFTYQDLPPSIDYVLLTHAHQDHVMFETLLQIRHRVRHVVVPKNNGGTLQDPSLRVLLETLGFRSVIELDEMGAVEVEGGRIVGLPFLGEHGDLHIRTKLAFWIQLEGTSVLCAADSNNLETEIYRHIRRDLGELDVLLLGMECAGAPMSWLYGPLLTRPLDRAMDQSRRLNGSNSERGMGVVDALQPKAVCVYAMGQEPWLTYVSSIQYTEQSEPIVESNKLVAACRERGLAAERLFGQKELHLTGGGVREVCVGGDEAAVAAG